jgi:hypothetical protein
MGGEVMNEDDELTGRAEKRVTWAARACEAAFRDTHAAGVPVEGLIAEG